jgi:hypothetical protein
MAGSPNHRNEQTGNAGLDRIQGNVRDLVQFVKQLLARLVTMEAGHGLPRLARIRCPDEDFTMTAADAACGAWLFEGTISATRQVTVPRAVAPGAYTRLVYNDTTGGFNVTLRTEDGTYAVTPGGAFVIVTRDFGPENWL